MSLVCGIFIQVRKISSRDFRAMSIYKSLGLAKLILEHHPLQAGTLSVLVCRGLKAVKLLSMTGLTHVVTCRNCSGGFFAVICRSDSLFSVKMSQAEGLAITYSCYCCKLFLRSVFFAYLAIKQRCRVLHVFWQCWNYFHKYF